MKHSSKTETVFHSGVYSALIDRLCQSFFWIAAENNVIKEVEAGFNDAVSGIKRTISSHSLREIMQLFSPQMDYPL